MLTILSSRIHNMVIDCFLGRGDALTMEREKGEKRKVAKGSSINIEIQINLK